MGFQKCFGIADRADVEDIEDSEGIKFVDAMRESGFDFLDGEPRFKDMDAFVELHIEQGNALEKAGLAVGVVNSIVGQKRFDVTLKGEANHAGTTKMVYRRDAVDAMSRMMSQCLDKAREIGDPLVLTFGHITVVPNVVNVVPGEVTFSIDCRHTTQEDLDEFAEWMVQKMEDVATDYNIDIDVDMWMDDSSSMDEDPIKMFEEVCAEGN